MAERTQSGLESFLEPTQAGLDGPKDADKGGLQQVIKTLEELEARVGDCRVKYPSLVERLGRDLLTNLHVFLKSLGGSIESLVAKHRESVGRDIWRNTNAFGDFLRRVESKVDQAKPIIYEPSVPSGADDGDVEFFFQA